MALTGFELSVTRRPTPEKHRLSLLPDIYIEHGDKSDWELLRALHYKAENLGIGPRFYRCTYYDQTIGVGVITVPKMLLSGRNRLFPNLHPNQRGKDTRIINRHRAKWVNAHFCTCSRLVLDTMYRGAGIAYRMQNIMMRMTGCRTIEFQSSMSKFNPFAEKAGIRFTKPRRSNGYERGLTWFRRWFESIPTDFIGVTNEIDAMTDAERDKCVAEMRRLYFKLSSMEQSGDNRLRGTSRVDALPVRKLLKNLQQLVFASPLYGVYTNPDFEIIRSETVNYPDKIPVLAFDNQSVTEPLKLNLL
jgi:ABC-type ATPase with predicted acetyltransferase domain